MLLDCGGWSNLSRVKRYLHLLWFHYPTLVCARPYMRACCSWIRPARQHQSCTPTSSVMVHERHHVGEIKRPISGSLLSYFITHLTSQSGARDHRGCTDCDYNAHKCQERENILSLLYENSPELHINTVACAELEIAQLFLSAGKCRCSSCTGGHFWSFQVFLLEGIHL